jgi:hypothetical protein
MLLKIKISQSDGMLFSILSSKHIAACIFIAVMSVSLSDTFLREKQVALLSTVLCIKLCDKDRRLLPKGLCHYD